LVVEGNFLSNYKRRFLSNGAKFLSLLLTTLGEIGTLFVSTHLTLKLADIFGDSLAGVETTFSLWFQMDLV